MRRLVRMVFSRTVQRFFSRWFWPYRDFDFAREVGEPLSSSTVAAPVMWFARTFPEAPPALWRKLDNGQEEQEREHGLLRLLQRPNPHFTGPLLWMATTVDWLTNGDGYWTLIPNSRGEPVEAWYTPSWMMEPKGSEDGKEFITHYEYRVDGEPIKLDPAYVVHFRYGADPENPRKGWSPLRSVLAEIFTDNEAARFTAAILRNMGVPGLIVSPKQGSTIPPEEAEQAKEDLKEKFTGDKRGEPIVIEGPTDIAQFGFSPEQLTLRELRRIPEERTTAVLGIPAIVAGLGAGLDRSTFTNFGEAREAAYENGIIPCQNLLSEDIRFQILPLYGEDPFAWRFGFDLAKVRVLQEDLYRQAQRHAIGVREGVEKVSEWRRAMGLEVGDEDDIYLRQANVVEVPADGGKPRPLAPAKSRNGNGGTSAAEVAAEVEHMLDRRELTTAR
jgi:HK97 family phage portal protein